MGLRQVSGYVVSYNIDFLRKHNSGISHRDQSPLPTCGHQGKIYIACCKEDSLVALMLLQSSVVCIEDTDLSANTCKLLVECTFFLETSGYLGVADWSELQELLLIGFQGVKS